jgi:hypothetical protein
MRTIAHIMLLLATLPVVSVAQTLEISVVTDWETVSYYGSIEETQKAIDAAVDYADTIFTEQLGIDIDVVYVDIPLTSADDTIANHTHVNFLMESVFDYRINTQHIQADATVFLTIRDLGSGSTDYAGYANIKSICSANAIALVELFNNGLDGETLAHELAHVLGAVHDEDTPCSNTGYLMSHAVHSGNSQLSQCSIDAIKETVEIYGSCMVETDPVDPVITPVPKRSGGSGSMDIFFLLMLIAVMSAQSTRTE